MNSSNTNGTNTAGDSNPGGIGLGSATTIVAASMIGVGVYTTSGFTIASLHTPGRVIAAWVIGALISICGAIGYAMLSRRFTESGGEYLFLSRTLHPAAGVTAGVVSMLSGFTGGIVLAAIGLENYLAPLLFRDPESIPAGTIAITVILFVAVIQTLGLKWAAKTQNAVVVAKVVMILAFLVIAFFSATQNDWPIATPIAEGTTVEATAVAEPSTRTNTSTSTTAETEIPPFEIFAFASQLVWISFSFAGFNAAIYMAGEIRNPARNVPRAILGGTVAVSVVYVLLNTVFVYASPVAVISGKEDIAAITAGLIGGDSFELFVRLVIVVSLFTSVYAMVMTGPRVYAKMAEDGFLPQWFRSGSGSSIVGVWFQAGVAAIVTIFATLESMLGYLGLTLSLCSALTVAMVLRPSVWAACASSVSNASAPGRGITLPWLRLGYVGSALYVVATLVLACFAGVDSPGKAWAAVGTLLIGVVLFPMIRSQTLTNSEADGS